MMNKLLSQNLEREDRRSLLRSRRVLKKWVQTEVVLPLRVKKERFLKAMRDLEYDQAQTLSFFLVMGVHLLLIILMFLL